MKRLFSSLKFREKPEKKAGTAASRRRASLDKPNAAVHGGIRLSC